MKPTCCLIQFTPLPYFLFLSWSFDDAVCNPHAASFIYSFFISFIIVWRHGVQPTCRVVYFLIFYFIWRRGVQPTCHVVYLLILYFFHYRLTTRCATHMPCCLFFNFLFRLTMRCATHMLCLFYFFLFFHYWRHGVQPTCRVVYFLFLLLSFDDVVCNPHAVSYVFYSFYYCLMMWCVTHMLHHLFFISFIIVWWGSACLYTFRFY